MKSLFRCQNWCARCGASIIVRNTFPVRCSVFYATARCNPPRWRFADRARRAFQPLFLCFTYNPGRVMKLSYNWVFLPEGTRIVCYNRASFNKWTAFSHGFRK
ncbi:hypothetical protein EcCFBP13530_08370 [Enterobacter cancerogenus]|uniref:Uncharacterized protein n=1 Tax=Enterobacter cancerogenus TaxID=69218 RepID=A0AB38P6X7_9ENTR|nr:hypothetical protein EcCFBP13530_08370 [Enterobacter cancerogenus]